IALLAVVVVIVRFGNLSAPACRRCFVMIILLDLCVQNWHLPPMVDREFFERPPVLLNEIPIGKEPFRIYSGLLENEPRSISLPGIPNRYVEQLMTVELLKPYFGLVYGLEYSEGVPGMALGLESVVLTWKMFKKASPAKRRRMLERSNVGFWVDLDKPFPRSMDGVPIILPGRVKRLDDALPRAFLVNRARVEKPVSLLNTYLDAHFDPLKEVLIEEPVALSPHPDFVGEVEELTYTPNHVRLRTRQNGDAMLVLLDSFFPGWEVTVDGAPEKIHRANHFFRAVRLPPGDHLIEFQYVPAGFQLGIGITLASLAAALGFLGWEIRRLRKKSLPAVEKSIISN
ncbi:MAG: YfhO family protein, partial [Nitrospinaceae bacterium]